jgi:uncharacterized protein (TIGR03435 family)
VQWTVYPALPGLWIFPVQSVLLPRPATIATRSSTVRRNLSAGSDAPHPSIRAAIQEQLGMKLEPSRDSVEVLVIDRAEKPSVN